MEDDESTIIDFNQFNNKGYKGDDDFETWMQNEAPFVPDTIVTGTGTGMGGTIDSNLVNTYTITNTGTLGEGSSAYATTININVPHYAPSKQKKLPIDILYKWYPKQMKEADD